MTQSPSRYNTGPPDLSSVGLSSPPPLPHSVPPAQLRSPLRRSPPQAQVSRRAPRSARRPQVQCQGQSGHDSQSCRSRGERARTRLSSERSGECGLLLVRSFVYSFIRLFRVPVCPCSRVSAAYRFLDGGERIERVVSYRARVDRSSTFPFLLRASGCPRQRCGRRTSALWLCHYATTVADDRPGT